MSTLCRFDYLLSILPALEPIGSIPPLTKQELWDQIVVGHGPVETIEVILLSDDLMQREALLCQEKAPDEADLVILSESSTEEEFILLEFLLPEEGTESHENARLAVDEDVCFHHFEPPFEREKVKHQSPVVSTRRRA